MRFISLIFLLMFFKAGAQPRAGWRPIPISGGGGSTSPSGIPSSADRFYDLDHSRTDVTLNAAPYNITSSSTSGFTTLRTNLGGTDKPAYNLIAPANALQLASTDANDLNLWPEDIVDFKLTGTAGSTSFQATSTNENPFAAMSPFIPLAHTAAGSAAGSGDRFDGTKGNNYVTLKTPSDATKYSVGERVLIEGDDNQYGGMPPNPFRFQYATVVSANSTTGVIVIDQPLQFDFNGDLWWEVNDYAGENWGGTSYSIGRPRIHDLWKSNGFRWNRHMVFDKFNYKPRLSGTASSLMSGDTVVFKDIYFEDLVSIWPSQSHITALIDCNMSDSEPDKVCDSVFYLRCTIRDGIATDGGFTGGTGIKHLDVRFSNFGFTGLNPHYGYWEGNTCTRSNGGFGWYVQPMGKVTLRYDYKNNSFVSPGNNEGATSMGFVNNFTIDNSNVQIASSSGFSLIDDSKDGTPNDHPYRDKTYTIRVGSPLWTSSGKVCYVTHTDYVSDRFIIRTTASGSNLPSNGETWYYTHMLQMRDFGGNTHSVYGIPFLSPYDRRWSGDTTTTLLTNHLSIFDEDDVKKTHVLDNMNLFGLIDSFTVDVRTVSTISGSVFLRVLKGSTELFKVNLKQTGKRTFGVSGNSGFVGTDVANSDTPLDTWANDISIQMVDGSNNMIGGANTSNEGDWDVRMKWWPYQNTRILP